MKKIIFALTILKLLIWSFAAVPPLGSFNVDQNAISVSGLSSGAFMSIQLHVARSDVFMGVGVVAGGPFYCAKNSLSTALTNCMMSPATINVGSLVSNAETQEGKDLVSPLINLSNSKVYIYSGTRDTTVVPGVVKKAETFYDSFVDSGNIITEYTIASAHGFPTMNNGGLCGQLNEDTFINDCNYDTAYHILNHIYGGNLKVPDYSSNAPNPAGNVYMFDQSEFVNVLNPNSVGLYSYGYIFVPDSCADGSKACKLHVSLHGCKQGPDFIGDTYVMETGYNEVAALNDIIVLYPQASEIPLQNGNGCWDWWGYTNGEYAYNDGIQVVSIMDMIERLTKNSVVSSTTTPYITQSIPITSTSSEVITSTSSPTTSTSTQETGVLGSYKVDKTAISVSGLSSGADMAIQMHVSQSDTFMGVGAVAGAPYYCAMNNVGIATTYCMYMPYMISVSLLESVAENEAASGTVADLSNLLDAKVYLFSGSKDTVVWQGVVEKAEEFYKAYVNSANIEAEYSIDAQNGFPTMNKGGPCDSINDDGLNNCQFDTAFEILNHIYGGPLQRPNYDSTESLKGDLLPFSQTEFVGVSDPKSLGLNEDGLVFVPSSCSSGSAVCRLHIAFHGCKHGDDSIAEAFANNAGYNEVAALNNIIVLYPQSATILLTNPQDCWDWWGYTDKDYAFKDGKQITAVMNMINRLVA